MCICRLIRNRPIHRHSPGESILMAMDKACSEDFKKVCRNVISPYGDGHAAEKIAKISIDAVKRGISLKKRFYDLDKYRDQ